MDVLQIGDLVYGQSSKRSHTNHHNKVTCRSETVAGVFNDARGIKGEVNNAECDDGGGKLVRC